MRAGVPPNQRGPIDKLGSALQEHGTRRIRAGSATAMLNGWNQMHELPIVLVMDASAFPTASEKNPKLTIAALSWRATYNLAE